jgi:LPS-assembly protein
MTSRTRFLITATLLCHQLLAPGLVTSQLPSSAKTKSDPSNLANAPSSLKQQDVTMIALQQEKQGDVYTLRGKAEIHYGTYILHADEMTYNSDTGLATADGHVLLEGGPNDERVNANHATYNLQSESGMFEHAMGSIGARLRANRLLLTSSNPFFFSGEKVEKTGPNHYKVYDGVVTTCDLPKPKWQFNAQKVDVEVGGTAKIYHTTFGLQGIPVLYLPFATLPAERLPRQTGFLIPNVGTSSIKGTILGESVFWAINRSMDAHLGAEYYSKRGWAPEGEFRAMGSEKAFADLTYFSVLDRGYGNPHMNQAGEEARLSAEDELEHKFRAVADVDYLSSFAFRLGFSEVFTEAVNSEVRSNAFVSNATSGYFYNASMQRYQDFESSTAGQVITILHAPGVELSSVDHAIGDSPVYWSYDAAFEGLSRSEPGFSTAPLLGRFDVNPTLSMPLLVGGWSFRPELSLRDTAYTQELEVLSGNVQKAVSDAINRKSLEGSFEIRPPAVDRVFDREFLGRKWKHVVEPRVVYDYVTGINNFSNILRFDQRDILTNSNGVEYAVVNRLYAKRVAANPENCGPPGMPLLFVGGTVPYHPIPWVRQSLPTDLPCNGGPEVREVVTWELAQKYFIDPTFGGALIPGRSNVFTSTIDLTGISFLAEPRHLSPLISRLRVQSSTRTDIEWDVDYDFRRALCVPSSVSTCAAVSDSSGINSSMVLLNYRVGPFTIGGGDAFLHVPPEAGFQLPVSSQKFNQYRLLLGYGHTNKPGFSAAANVGVDANLNYLQYAALQTTYNWDCCGVNLEFRRFALGSVRNENQYRFTFALANLGALGNLRKAERLF